MLLIIDNYDSFTYNLVQYLGDLGQKVRVYRNDKITVEGIRKEKPDRLVISPGPCTPREAGISMEVISAFGGTIPILGVCLGHQSIGQVYGGKVIRAPQVMHGKVSMIHHTGKNIFKGVSNPFEATRYHSLIVERKNLPDVLEVTAWTKDGLVMGLQHKTHPVFGVQFHPESILTFEGKKIFQNFLDVA